MYDVAIIGAGPAAVSAALNLSLHDKNIIWFGSGKLSNKVEKSEKIANYPGIPYVTGVELNAGFLGQIDAMGIEITERMVTNIGKTKNGYMVLGGNEVYDSKTVLLCTGAVSAKGFDGEEELLGRGISYCATCDGFLYKDKIIGVFCGDKRYEHEVKYLAEIAKEVILWTAYKDCGINMINVSKADKPIKSINGNEKTDSVTLTDGSKLELDGVFILRNAVAPAKLLNGIKMDGAHIAVDRAMKTNLKGCFAAGDCTGRPYQIAKAVGEGNVAAHSILEYLDEDKKSEKGSSR